MSYSARYHWNYLINCQTNGDDLFTQQFTQKIRNYTRIMHTAFPDFAK